MENESKTCKNCKYAKQHYMINADMRFVTLPNEMHCCHGSVNKTKFKEYFKGKKTCNTGNRTNCGGRKIFTE